MNIVITSKRYAPLLGGTVRWVQMLASELNMRGHDVTVLTRTPGEPEPGLIRFPKLSKHIEHAREADVVIQVDASWRDALPFLVFGVPWVPTIQFGRDPLNPPLRKRLVELVLKVAFKIGNTIPMSRATGESWGITEEPIYNPFDQELFFLPNDGSDRPIDFVFVGRMEQSKGIFLLLDALRKLTNEGHRIRASFLGDGPDLDHFRKLSAKPVPGLTVDIVGAAGSSEVADWLRRSKVLVLPTMPEWIEASPLVLVEAQACGCRVIASDSGGSKESIGPFGKLIESGSAPSLLNELREHVNVRPFTKEEISAQIEFLRDRSLEFVAEQLLLRINKIRTRRS